MEGYNRIAIGPEHEPKNHKNKNLEAFYFRAILGRKARTRYGKIIGVGVGQW